MGTQTVLSINGLSKNYGNLRALNNLSLEVNEGEVFCILGPNGSGKSTTLGILLGVLKKDEGAFSWFEQGESPNLRLKVGTLLEQPNFIPHLSGKRNLEICATIKRVEFHDIVRVMRIAKLEERMDSRFSTYSTGMKQRLAIANAMLGNPRVLVLDEPTNGLDPQGIAEVREIIRHQADEGKTIIMASHLLDEVEKVCTHVAVIQKGNLKYSGPVENLTSTQNEIQVSAEDMVKLKVLLSQNTMIKEIRLLDSHYSIVADAKLDTSSLNQYLFKNGVSVSHLAQKKQSLEKQFLELTNTSS